MKKTIYGETTKSGLAALWEEGGASVNHEGKARIVAKPNGDRPTRLFGPSFPEANGKHALLVVHPGHFVIEAEQKRGKFLINLYRASSVRIIDDERAEIVLQTVGRFVNGSWDNVPSEKLQDAIEAAKQKAQMVNCKNCVYAKWAKNGSVFEYRRW